MAESRTQWQPQENQRRFLSVMQAHGYKIDIQDACTEAEIGRQTYYDWTHNEDWLAWWNFERSRYWSMRLHCVDAAVFESATNAKAVGNAQSQKLAYERYDEGYQPGTRSTITADVNVKTHSEIIEAGLNGGFPTPAEPGTEGQD